MDLRAGAGAQFGGGDGWVGEGAVSSPHDNGEIVAEGQKEVTSKMPTRNEH